MVRSLLYPVTRCRTGRKRFLPFRAPRNNQTPDPNVFSSSDQPNMFLITLTSPGDTGVLKRQVGQFTVTTHPGTISTSRKSSRRNPVCILPTPLHVTLMAPAEEKQASLQQDTQPGSEYSYSTPLFLHRHPVLGPPTELCDLNTNRASCKPCRERASEFSCMRACE